MRPITSGALAKAQEQFGLNATVVVKVEWATGTRYYADRATVFSSEKRLISIGEIMSQKKEQGAAAVGVVTLTLDDADGGLKAQIDDNFVEGTIVSIFEVFDTLAEPDAFLIYEGIAVSPIEWLEGERILKLDVETRTRDTEVGFSADLGSIPNLNVDAVDQPWPITFGSPIHVPALLLQTGPSTSLNSGITGGAGTSPPDSATFLLSDGSVFPNQVPIQVIVGGVVFSGHTGPPSPSPFANTFYITESNLAKFNNIQFGARDATDPDYQNPTVAWLGTPISLVNLQCWIAQPGIPRYVARVTKQVGAKVWFAMSPTLPHFVSPTSDPLRVNPGLIGPDSQVVEAAKYTRTSWVVVNNNSATPSDSSFSGSQGVLGAFSNASANAPFVFNYASYRWNIQAGQVVKQWGVPDVWVVNLLPSSSIKGVYAQKSVNGESEWVAIPLTYYAKDLSNSALQALFGPDVFPATPPTTITFQYPLSTYSGAGWGSQIYVTSFSSVGPNVVDVLENLITTYSTLAYDSTSFASVKTAQANYPVNFSKAHKINVVQWVEEIAFQARIGVILDLGAFYLKYLSIEPSPDLTVDEDLIQNRTITQTYSPLEEIVTRFRAKWTLTLRGDRASQKEYVYKENIARFGLHTKIYDLYIYNTFSLVKKSADFWGHRLANSWRVARATTPSDELQLQIFDCAKFNLTDTTILGTMKGTTRRTNYDIDKQMIAIEVELASVAGTLTQDPTYWRSDSGDVLPPNPAISYLEQTLDDQQIDQGTLANHRSIVNQNQDVMPGVGTGITFDTPDANNYTSGTNTSGDPTPVSDSNITPTNVTQSTLAANLSNPDIVGSPPTADGRAQAIAVTQSFAASQGYDADPGAASLLANAAASVKAGTPTGTVISNSVADKAAYLAVCQANGNLMIPTVVSPLPTGGTGQVVVTQGGPQVTALAIGDPPRKGQQCLIFNYGGTTFEVAPGSQVFAAIVTAITPVIMVDAYDAGFTSPKTGTGIIATVVDPSFAPVVDQRVVVFSNKGAFYIIGAAGGSTLQFAHLLVQTTVGGINQYSWEGWDPVTRMAVPPLTPPGVAYEMNNSASCANAIVAMNMIGANGYFCLPIGTC